ncbi:MAG: hypothetical protein ACRD2L_09670 [Terriglobia bacterium]
MELLENATVQLTGDALADIIERAVVDIDKEENEEERERRKEHVKALLYDVVPVIVLALRRFDAEETLQNLFGVEPMEIKPS